MRKRNAFVGCLFVCASLLAVASVGLSQEVAQFETDESIYQICCEAADWQPPEAYILEGFLRADINGDEITDALVVLKNGEGDRLLSLLLSGSEGYFVIESSRALPSLSGAEDALAGIALSPGAFTLCTSGGGDAPYRNEFTFAGAEDRFQLTSLSSLFWDPVSGAAVQNVFDYAADEYTSATGRMDGEVFTPEQRVSERLPFVGDTYIADIARFNIEDFPITWEFPGALDEEKMALQCADCGEWFADETALASHSCAAAPDGQIYCNICDGWFEEGEAFRRHVCEAVEKPYACEICGGVFETEQAYIGHACKKPEIQSITCNVCGESFEADYAYLSHVCVSYPAEGLVYCDVCGRSFAEGEAFRSHECI